MSPGVSVIVCAYNAEKTLAQTLESVLAQTHKDFELVVVDDGSKDGTRRIVESYGRAVRYHFQPNAGFGAARNKAVSLSQGEWIAVIDHDDLCLPERLEAQAAAARAHPEAALIFSDSEHFQDDGSVLRRQFEHFNPCALDLRPGAAAEALLVHGCFIDSETAFFRKDAALAAGGFDESYRYVNDYDFFLRFGLKHSFAGVDRVLARWRVHPGQLTQTAHETIVREHLKLYREWAARPGIGEEGLRGARLRLFGHLFRALRLNALRRENGGSATLLREMVRMGPRSPEDFSWCLERLAGKL
jgi:glycosyltransferase involved in cell wall biosynthesis